VTDTVITAVSCPGTDDGSIVLSINGGKQPVGITWETNPPQFGPTARNLPPGQVAVTIFDNSNPSLILRDTFEVPLNSDLPTANAGADKPFVCNPPIVPLEGQGSTGANYSYAWTTENGRLVPDVNKLVSGALAPGVYVLEVTNTTTGCVAKDSIEIIAQDFPRADAGFDGSFLCSTESVTLGGQTSSTGANISYLWVARNGGEVPAGQETLLQTTVAKPGTYILAVTNSQSSCVARDTVVVEDLTQDFPNANAGIDQPIGCADTSTVVLGSASVNDTLSVAYEWLTLNGEVIANSDTVQVDSLGTYLLKVTNTTSGCASIDTVKVIPNEDFPTLNIGMTQAITCLTDTVTINAIVGNSSNFTFEWTASEGGEFVTGTDTTLTPKIATAGLYQLSVVDTSTSCSIADTVRVASNIDPPLVEAGADTMITCRDTMLVLNATGTAEGADFTYKWTLNGQEVASATLQPEINAPGTYYLEVSNTVTGCLGIDSVKVVPNLDAPQVSLPVDIVKLNCSTPSKTVQATIANPKPDFIIKWTTTGGSIVGSDSTATIEVNKAGTYQIQVTNSVNGCVFNGDAVVEDDSALPTAVAGDSTKLTCITDVIALNGVGSSVGADFTYQWNAIGGGTPPSPNNALQTSVNTAGTYELMVTNIQTGCIGRDTIFIGDDKTPPNISIAAPQQLSCTVSKVTLDASGSSTGVTAEWKGLDGGTATIITPLKAEVSQGGRYELILTSDGNGCSARDTITVQVDENRPLAAIATPDTLTCREPSTTLDASSSTVNGAFTTQWTKISGNGTVQVNATNPLLATAQGAGTYQLKITRTSDGCQALDTITVAEDTNFPMASATAAQSSIGCGESTMLNSTGSSSGANISYLWSVLNGTATIANPNQQSISIDKAGTFQLVVSNNSNGCSDTATVSITFNVQFELANAGGDQGVCEPTTTLTANAPTGTTGVWASPTGVTLSATNQAVVTASSLKTGDNRFVWTLSAPGCANYSADTVVVKLESAPLAADDALTLKAGETSGSVLVTGNDQISNVATFSISISQNPMFGAASVTTGGRVAYSVKPGVFGTDEFAYTICSSNCPTFCDSAFVQILIEEDPNFEAPPRTNAITPNGDGVNEQLVFDELLFNPEQYPDNELIIFNRWGDIVFQAKPYNNQWDGTNEMGQNLPEGTYYYILRLNISEGIIIRGDVTILR
ncbi:MAG: gliding motility-associated C-terminal domain-containing protein, partial [Saprospiraceae bacterium]|nr:gliding motility-associated C-terminal domain-containing protein [Saprospiraceae bacterium]